MLSWFFKSKKTHHPNITIKQTTEGNHSIHWRALYQEINLEKVVNRVIQSIEGNTPYVLDRSTRIFTDPLIRSILYGDRVITGFPYLHTSRYEQCVVASISEWAHIHNLEAIVAVEHTSGCGIHFFATDYATNRVRYRSEQNLSINIVGLVYFLEEFNSLEWNQLAAEMRPESLPEGIKFSDDFCSFFPTGASPDEMHIMGRVKNVQAHSLGEIPGYLFTVGVTPDYDLECFIAQENLSITLEAGVSVRGVAWIQGAMEK